MNEQLALAMILDLYGQVLDLQAQLAAANQTIGRQETLLAVAREEFRKDETDEAAPPGVE